MAELQPAFVLHRSRYRDTSLLVELLTRDEGRKAVIARGAMGKSVKSGKSSKASERAGLLQAFRPLLLSYQGRGDLGSLTRVEPAESGFVLSGTQLYCGLYVNELLMRLTQRDDAHPALFSAYMATLAELASGMVPDTPLRFFELQLLQTLGFALQLTTEAGSELPVEAHKRYHYRIGEGPVAAGIASGGVSGDTLLCLARNDELQGVARGEARVLMRYVLNHYLDGRPLRSRELFQTLGARTSPQ